MANRVIVEKETNWDDDTAANSQQTEEWFAATNATEAKLALFAKLYYFQRFLSQENIKQIEELVQNSQLDLSAYMEDLADMEITQQKLNDESAETYSSILLSSLQEHQQLYQQAKP